MSANVSRPKRLCSIKNAVNGVRKPNVRNKRRPNAIGRLNDFCLLQIFNRLDLEDLVNLTDLNNQFKRVSEMSFAGRYAAFTYYESRHSQIRRAVCKFGKSIKSLKFRGRCLESNEIPKFCAGGTLEELHLTTNKMMNDDDYTRRLFSSLKTLTLDYYECNGYSNATLFGECQELKTLHLQRIPRCGLISDVAQKYRKLEELVIGKDVNHRTTRVLLKSNRQITKLDMPGTYRTTFAMLSKMVHLEELSIRHVWNVSCYNNIAKLAALNSLRVLKLHSVHPKFVTMIVDEMENVHSLDCFKCIDVSYDPDRDWSNYEFANQIKKLKALKSLAFIVRNLVLGDCFAELGGQLPLLQDLELNFSEKQWQNDPAHSTGNLIRFIELSSTLEVLIIRTVRPEAFNQHFYDRLLRVIQRRQSSKTFKVKLCCFRPHLTTLNIHSNLLQVEVNTSWS